MFAKNSKALKKGAVSTVSVKGEIFGIGEVRLKISKMDQNYYRVCACDGKQGALHSEFTVGSLVLEKAIEHGRIVTSSGVLVFDGPEGRRLIREILGA